MAELRNLSRSECEALLRRGEVGRVALATPTGPHIVPVNYTVSRGDVVVATAPYSVLGSSGRDTLLAFEVDHVEHAQQRGWSVVVRGRAEMVEDPEEVRTLGRLLPRPWASGTRTLYLRIPLDEVSGRRLGGGWDLEATMPQRPTT
ncbi:pyridoxamine 5'-phosphate oxidase family protein [Nocardioides currus]|uniref:Pyridoxamine 5'-phosphate oxidase n=1 Tax=Nocardioides currus TaxID=2133958 RepID=A0A2R7Z2C8_9ACTN|nr:pyridoxamine 5'-phosphate oxidase family protein [Nocardioides currus]PUA82309.1 pyridoxamine 5'-phosphate oxidase [Nocardioides currus]